MDSFDFKSLTERRVEFNVTFIYTVLDGVIDALNLSFTISLAVPLYYSRNSSTFKTIDTQLLCIVLITLLIIC